MNISSPILFGATQAVYTSPLLAAIALAQAPTDQLGAELHCISRFLSSEDPTTGHFFGTFLTVYKDNLTDGNKNGARQTQLEMAKIIQDLPAEKWKKIIGKAEETGWATAGGFFATPPTVLKRIHWALIKDTGETTRAIRDQFHWGLSRAQSLQSFLLENSSPNSRIVRDCLVDAGRKNPESFEKALNAVGSAELIWHLEGEKPREETAPLHFALLYYYFNMEQMVTHLFRHLMAHPESIAPILEFLKNAMLSARRRQNIWLRFYILTLAEHLVQRAEEQSKPAPELRMMLYAIGKDGLGDPMPMNALKAWNVAHTLAPRLTEDVLPKNFSRGSGWGAMQSPELGLKKFVRSEWPYTMAWQEIAPSLETDCEYSNARQSIGDFFPIHSLRDFHPDPQQRAPLMENNYRLIKKIMAESKPAVSAAFFREYFSLSSPADPVREIFVLSLDFGKRYLIQGHHRMAALYKAAEEGVIPKIWLYAIPVTLARYQGPLPERLLVRCMTLGVCLDWPELFPC